MKRIILSILILMLFVGVVQAGDFERAKDTASKINQTLHDKVPYTITMTHAQIVAAGYTPLRDGDYKLVLKDIEYDEANGTLVTYINAYNTFDSVYISFPLQVHNPVRWYLPYNETRNGAALQQAYVVMVLAYLDTLPIGNPLNDDTLIVYPTVDGYAQDTTSTTYSSLRSDTGAAASSGSTTTVNAPLIDAAATSPNFHIFNRGILSFNTSAIPDDATVNSANLSVKMIAKTNGLGSPNYGITGGVLADNTTIASGDYDGWTGVRYASDVSYTSITANARTNWSINAAGVANISKTGYTVMYMRDSWDIDNSAPTYSKNAVTSITWQPVGNTTSSGQPFLEIVYTPAIPVAGFTANATSGTEPLSVQFTDQTTGCVTAWSWYWYANETLSSSDQNPTAVFSAGTYNVRLYASNSAGGDWENKTSYITASPLITENVTCGESAFSASWTASGDSWTKTNDECTLRMWNATGTHYFDADAAGVSNFSYAIVAGGGSGGAAWRAAGGGAGGVLTGNTSMTGNITLTVGPGGSAGNQLANNGTNSTFGILTAIGGGQGGHFNDGFMPNGSNGGSGGGGADWTDHAGGLGTPGQGNNGGNKTNSGNTNCGAGGGGGATGVGGTVTSTSVGGAGGTGVNLSMFGITANGGMVAGGGGGCGAYGYEGGEGGSGVGGHGGTDRSPSTVRPGNGTPGTGSGGGGEGGLDWASSLGGGWGGSGVVIIKYKTGGGASAPVASFTINRNPVRIPLSITVNDTSTNTPTAWNWSWGDGTSNSTTQNSSHSYTKRGRFNIILTATNAGGNGVNSSNYVRVVGYENYY